MNINEFLIIAEEFFDIVHPNFCEDFVQDSVESEFWTICEEFFQEINPPPHLLFED